MQNWFPIVHALLLLAQLSVMLWAVKIARDSIQAHRKLEGQKAFLTFIAAYNASPETDEALAFLRGEEKRRKAANENIFLNDGFSLGMRYNSVFPTTKEICAMNPEGIRK